MRRDRLRRASVLRAFALGAVLAPLVVAGGAVSCILADPPPELPTVPPQVPYILRESVVPPADQIFTDWPDGGLDLIVPVEVLNPILQYQYLLMKDYMTPNSAPAGARYSGALGPPNPDAGGFELVPIIPIEKPLDANCHTYSLFVGLSLVPQLSANPEQGFTVRASAGSDMVTWTYSPSGGIGTCAAYDAAGLTDSAPQSTDAADLDGGVIVQVDSGH